MTQIAWIDALSPRQSLLLFLALLLVWLAGLAYAILFVQGSQRLRSPRVPGAARRRRRSSVPRRCDP